MLRKWRKHGKGVFSHDIFALGKKSDRWEKEFSVSVCRWEKLILLKDFNSY
jgi:hypothetical protein